MKSNTCKRAYTFKSSCPGFMNVGHTLRLTISDGSRGKCVNVARRAELTEAAVGFARSKRRGGMKVTFNRL